MVLGVVSSSQTFPPTCQVLGVTDWPNAQPTTCAAWVAIAWSYCSGNNNIIYISLSFLLQLTFSFLRYLNSESDAKRGFRLDVKDWKLIKSCKGPIQTNGYDCGVFICIFDDLVCKKMAPTFEQQHMPYFRYFSSSITPWKYFLIFDQRVLFQIYDALRNSSRGSVAMNFLLCAGAFYSFCLLKYSWSV